jgi:hypothetical protein
MGLVYGRGLERESERVAATGTFRAPDPPERVQRLESIAQEHGGPGRPESARRLIVVHRGGAAREEVDESERAGAA